MAARARGGLAEEDGAAALGVALERQQLVHRGQRLTAGGGAGEVLARQRSHRGVGAAEDLLAHKRPRRVGQLSVGGQAQQHLAALGRRDQLLDRLAQLRRRGVRRREHVPRRQRRGPLGIDVGEDEELHVRVAAGVVGTAVGAAVVQARLGEESGVALGQVVEDGGVGVRADAPGDGPARDAHRPALAVAVDIDVAPAGLGEAPLQGRQLHLALGPEQPRLRPVGPVAAVVPAALRHDEPKARRAGDVDVDLHRAGGDDAAGIERLFRPVCGGNACREAGPVVGASELRPPSRHRPHVVRPRPRQVVHRVGGVAALHERDRVHRLLALLRRQPGRLRARNQRSHPLARVQPPDDVGEGIGPLQRVGVSQLFQQCRVDRLLLAVAAGAQCLEVPAVFAVVALGDREQHVARSIERHVAHRQRHVAPHGRKRIGSERRRVLHHVVARAAEGAEGEQADFAVRVVQQFPHALLGPAPPPRNWLSPREERELRESPEYPWNALR